MGVWRLCLAPYAAFDGEGARRHAGRWHPQSTGVVYVSSSLSLATLEYLTRLASGIWPDDLVAVPAEIPAEVRIEHADLARFPANWRDTPPPPTLREIGRAWFHGGLTAVLAVPSAVVPEECNYLLNPDHPEFRRIVVGKPRPFRLDPRFRR